MIRAPVGARLCASPLRRPLWVGLAKVDLVANAGPGYPTADGAPTPMPTNTSRARTRVGCDVRSRTTVRVVRSLRLPSGELANSRRRNVSPLAPCCQRVDCFEKGISRTPGALAAQ